MYDHIEWKVKHFITNYSNKKLFRLLYYFVSEKFNTVFRSVSTSSMNYAFLNMFCWIIALKSTNNIL